MLRVPNRGWTPPLTHATPMESLSLAAVTARPPGSAAYETWSRRMICIVAQAAKRAAGGLPTTLGAAWDPLTNGGTVARRALPRHQPPSGDAIGRWRLRHDPSSAALARRL